MTVVLRAQLLFSILSRQAIGLFSSRLLWAGVGGEAMPTVVVVRGL